MLMSFEFVIGVVAFDFVVPESTLRDGMDTSYGVNTPPMVSPQMLAGSFSHRLHH